MITTQKQFDRLLSAFKDEDTIKKLKSERADRVDLLDKFAGTEGFDYQIEMLETEIAQIDEALK